MRDVWMHIEYPPPRLVVQLDGEESRMTPDEALEKADELEQSFRDQGQWFGEMVAFVSDMRQKAEELQEWVNEND